MRAAALAALAALAAAAPALAGVSSKQIEARYSAGYRRCMASPSGQSTLGMLDCIQAETRAQDRRLNAAYAKAIEDMTPQERQGLQAAQRAWIAFRDADCAARVDTIQWGSISRINGALCVLDRTIERTIELETFPPNQG